MRAPPRPPGLGSSPDPPRAGPSCPTARADAVTGIARSTYAPLRAALATVPREAFLGAPPWVVPSVDGKRRETSDLADLYRNVLVSLDADKRLITELSDAESRRLVGDGTISGGMIPKVETCLEAVDGGTAAAVILDGRVPHAILVELFTGGAGTLIRGG